jgi:hypothetical protein
LSGRRRFDKSGATKITKDAKDTITFTAKTT